MEGKNISHGNSGSGPNFTFSLTTLLGVTETLPRSNDIEFPVNDRRAASWASATFVLGSIATSTIHGIVPFASEIVSTFSGPGIVSDVSKSHVMVFAVRSMITSACPDAAVK
jgi:hypothetical protein